MRDSQMLDIIGRLEQRVEYLYERLRAAGLLDEDEAGAHDDLAPVPSLQPSPMVQDLVRQGQKIRAIKLYREQTGVDLSTAKRAVDRLG